MYWRSYVLWWCLASHFNYFFCYHGIERFITKPPLQLQFNYQVYYYIYMTKVWFANSDTFINPVIFTYKKTHAVDLNDDELWLLAWLQTNYCITCNNCVHLHQSLGLGAVGVGGVATGHYLFLFSAEENELHPPHYPWGHNGWIDALDHARYILQ